jgi:hypothetical protein
MTGLGGVGEEESVEGISLSQARKLLILKTINTNISCLFTVSYTVIRHARDWRKRSRKPENLTLMTGPKNNDGGEKSSGLVMAAIGS